MTLKEIDEKIGDFKERYIESEVRKGRRLRDISTEEISDEEFEKFYKTLDFSDVSREELEKAVIESFVVKEAKEAGFIPLYPGSSTFVLPEKLKEIERQLNEDRKDA